LDLRKAETATETGTYWWAPLTSRLAELLTSCGFRTVPVVPGEWSFPCVFTENLPLLTGFKAEGLVLSCESGLFKWKNSRAETDAANDEANLKRIRSALQNTKMSGEADKVIGCLRQSAGTPDKSGLMEKMFVSASTKYQTLDDILHNSEGKDSVSKKVTELFLAIEKDMLGDSSAEDLSGIKNFLHKKKSSYMARYVPKK